MRYNTTTVVLADIPDDDLKRFIKDGVIPEFDFPKFPCHTQSVERCVKWVTESFTLVIGPESRDGFIRSRIKSREIISTFEKDNLKLPKRLKYNIIKYERLLLCFMLS